MRNIKIEKELTGSGYWPHMGVVEIGPDPNAQKLPTGLQKEEKEKIIQGWKGVAVIKVSPQVSFKVGFIIGSHMQFLRENVSTQEGKFGMRVGNEKKKIFTIPEDLNSEIKLEVIEITEEDNPKYTDLPLY